MKNPAFPDSVLKDAKSDSRKLTEDATAFLKRTHQTTLLSHAGKYEPIPRRYVALFAGHIKELLFGLAAYGIHLGSTSFAASVIPKRGLVFWDFFPARKQEAASLYPAD